MIPDDLSCCGSAVAVTGGRLIGRQRGVLRLSLFLEHRAAGRGAGVVGVEVERVGGPDALDVGQCLGIGRHAVVAVDGAFAGQIAVDPIIWGATRSAQVGYWIGSAWQGRGIMRLAVALVLDHLLGPVGLHRVEINVRPDNERSLALCRGLGLREEGLRRGYMHINGAWADHVSFAALAEEAHGPDGVGFQRRLIRG